MQLHMCVCDIPTLLFCSFVKFSCVFSFQCVFCWVLHMCIHACACLCRQSSHWVAWLLSCTRVDVQRTLLMNSCVSHVCRFVSFLSVVERIKISYSLSHTFLSLFRVLSLSMYLLAISLSLSLSLSLPLYRSIFCCIYLSSMSRHLRSVYLFLILPDSCRVVLHLPYAMFNGTQAASRSRHVAVSVGQRFPSRPVSALACAAVILIPVGE